MPTAHLSLQIQPRVPDARLYEVVDAVIDDIRATGLAHVVGPMETTIEGELGELLEIVHRAHLRCVELGAERVGATVKIDFKPAGIGFDEKLAHHGGGGLRRADASRGGADRDPDGA